jgi:hypothetical protein
MSAPTLLESVQLLLERTYRIRSGLGEIGRFVIGDAGFRELYRDGEHDGVGTDPGRDGSGARTLVRETDEGVRACIYYPDAMIRCLEAHPPHRGLGDENVDAFAVFVEEADHLLCIAERARDGRPVSLFELELHANVSKELVLARYLAGQATRLDERRRAWLRYHLFHKGSAADTDPAVRARYDDAARFALRFLEAAGRLVRAERLETLRRFHAAGAQHKLELIGKLAA